MSTRGDILRRAAQVEPDAVPEPWRPSDDEDALATVSDREHYRKNLVTLPDGAGEVPAYVWDFSRTPTIPEEVREEWTRGSAGRVLGPNGKYVSRGSDVPRLSYDGDEPGLLVEATERTNHILNSSDPSNWNKSDVTLTGATSIIKGETAHKADSTSGKFDFVSEDSGTTSGNPETILFILEEGSGGEVRMQLKQPGGAKHANLDFDWSSKSLLVDSTSSSATVDEKNFRQLEVTGPNGGLLIEVRFTISGVPSGQSRQVVLFPDRSGNQNFVYLHHAQLEEAPNASSPIVTQGSPVTRAGDDYAIFEGGQPSWWNPNEGTLIVTFSWQSYERGGSTRLVSDGPNARHLSIGGGFGIFSTDSRNTTGEVGTLTPFGLDRFALSFGQQDIILSVNGSSNNAGGHDGNLLSAQNLQIGEMDNLNGRFEKLLYTPRALPESTLNAITS